MQTVCAQIRTVHVGPPGRVRYAIPALHHDPLRVREVERVLAACAGVQQVRGNPHTGTLLVLFDPQQPRAPWETSLANLLGGSGVPQARATEREAHLATRVIALFSELREEHLISRKHRRPPGRTMPAPQPEPWHTLATEAVLAQLASSSRGLDGETAAQRIATHGANAIQEAPRRSELRIFADQLVSTPVIMLGASAVASAAMGGFGDAAAISAVVATNATIGYVTESSAERTIAALTNTAQEHVPVLRDGVEQSLPFEEITCGDVLLLRAGVFLAADARLLAASDLTVDESALTGESLPVLKSEHALHELTTPLAERSNMVYRGTLVTGGSGSALVVAIGAHTQLGHIQELAGSIEQRMTPMQRQLEQLGKQLAIGASAACLGVFGVGLLRGQAALPLVRTAISLAVAAVPEGLPTVAMTTLALGLAHMREERVLVRKLAAVETLGATQVVCLDKTGTLTINRMSAAALSTAGASYRVAHGRLQHADGGTDTLQPEVARLLEVAALCNEVVIEREGEAYVLRGSSTESALLQLALDAGIPVEALRARHPVRSVQRRAQARNYMSTLHEVDGRTLLAVKGRPSEVLALCAQVHVDGSDQPLGDARRARIETENERMAGRALRVLGFALRRDAGLGEPPAALVWLGLIGMDDPPREAVPELLVRFHQAGLRPIMITGDQSATAHAVARQVGLGRAERIDIVDSTRIDQIPADVLVELARHADVFSRVSPSHKLQIVRALQQSGLVVAMTGDGINDGPALRAADVGIAMGAGGTAAARELADIVLEDDQLGTLVGAIERGRTIYEDIRKAVHFILATNFSELAFTFACVTAGVDEPLTPIQLLWINLLTDIFPELALATQPSERDVMRRPPRNPQRPMFTYGDLGRIGLEGGAITAGALAAYFTTTRAGGAGTRAGTVGFSTLMLAQLMHAFSARSESRGIFDDGRIPTSRWLPIAIGSTAALQLLVSLAPPLRTLLGITPLCARDWGTSVVAATLPFLFNEGTKWFLNNGHWRPRAPSEARDETSDGDEQRIGDRGTS